MVFCDHIIKLIICISDEYYSESDDDDDNDSRTSSRSSTPSNIVQVDSLIDTHGAEFGSAGNQLL